MKFKNDSPIENILRKSAITLYIIIALVISNLNAQTSKDVRNEINLNMNNCCFIENKGQWPEDVLFMANTKSLRVWITRTSMTFQQFVIKDKDLRKINNDENKLRNISSNVISLDFIGNQKVNTEFLVPIERKFNFIIGNFKQRFKSDVKAYKEVIVYNIYEGIDIRYYFQDGEVRYDFIIHPFADPSQIEFEIKGSTSNKILNNNLFMETSYKPVIKKDLFAYQKEGNIGNMVDASFQLNGNHLKLNIGTYDKSKKLIIDPIVKTGENIIENEGIDNLTDITTDTEGNIYFCGFTFSMTFPEAGSNNPGGTSIVIGKIDHELQECVWTTFFGGSSGEYPCSIEIDNNYIYFNGITNSMSDFPLLNEKYSTFIVYNTNNPMGNNFLTVLNLSGELEYSSFLNSAASVTSEPDLKVDVNGNVYLTGGCWSDQFPAFIETNQIQTQNHSIQTVVEQSYIMGLRPVINELNQNPLSYDIIFSSLFCGLDPTSINAIDIDDSQINNSPNFPIDIYITGGTSSNNADFNITAENNGTAFQTTKNAQVFVPFVTKLTYPLAGPLTIKYNTFISNNNPNYVNEGLAPSCILFWKDTIYIGGRTNWGSIGQYKFPMKNAFDDFFEPENRFSYSGYISVITPNGLGNDDLIYSSYFGSNENSVIKSLTYDEECNSVIFAGNTESALTGFQGSIPEGMEFSGDIDIMIGMLKIDAGLTFQNTLVELSYIESGVYGFGRTPAVKNKENNNKIYLGSDYLLDRTDEDMAFFKLDIPACENGYIVCDCEDYDVSFDINESQIKDKDDPCCIKFEVSITPFLSNPSTGICNVNQIEILENIDENEKNSLKIWPKEQIAQILYFTYCGNEGQSFIDKVGETITFTLQFTLEDGRVCSVEETVLIKCPVPCDNERDEKPTITFVPNPNNSTSENCCYDIRLENSTSSNLKIRDIGFSFSKDIVANLFNLPGLISPKLPGNTITDWYAIQRSENQLSFGYYESGTNKEDIIIEPGDQEIIGNICIPKTTAFSNSIITPYWIDDSQGNSISEFLLICQIGDPLQLQCDPQLIDCCDDNLFEIILSPGGAGTNCSENQCAVTGKIVPYSNDECPTSNIFTHYSISPWNLKFVIPPDGVIPQYTTSSLACLNKGDSRRDVLKLYKGTEDTDPCIISKDIYCPIEDETEPCTPDCNGENGQPKVEWINKYLPPRPLPGCPDCFVQADYIYRTNTCHNPPLQEIQILNFTTFSTDLPDHDACNDCNMTDEDIYKFILKDIIFTNTMGFQPITASDGGNCYDTWRVVQLSCWVEYTVPGTFGGSVIKREPCSNSSCCSIGLTVCRFSDHPNPDYISITPNGNISGGSLCSLSTKKVYNPQGFGNPQVGSDGIITYNTTIELQCLDKCSWLAINDLQYNQSNYFGKESLIDFSDLTLNNGMDITVKLNRSIDEIECYIYSNHATDDFSISIFNILGQVIINQKNKLKKGLNIVKFDLNKYKSGSYLIQISVDGFIQSSEKFLIIK